MKKSFIYSLAAVFALAACSKEADVNVPTGETVTITAAVDQTRSTEEHASFSWATDEQISVGTSDDEYVAFGVTDAAKGLFSHTFTGETPDLLVAVSPVQANAGFAGADAYEVELPAIYNDYEPSKGVTNALMIGVPDPNTPKRFLFRHAAALLKITYANVPVGTAGFVLKADKPINNGWSGDKVLLGGTSVSDIEIDNTNSALVQENPTIINLKNAVTKANTTLTFYVPVPTGKYSMLQVSLTNGTDEIASTVKKMDRTGKTPLTLNRADVFIFPTITLNPAPEDKYYVKVTSDDDIVPGDYLIVHETQNNELEDEAEILSGVVNKIGTVAVSPIITDGEVLKIAQAGNEAYNIVVEEGTDGYTLKLGGSYLAYTGNSNNLFLVESATDDGTEWNLSAVDGITNVDDAERKLQYNYNNGNPRFACYKGTQVNVSLYFLEGSESAGKQSVSLSFNPTSVELALGESFTLPTLTTNPAGLSVTYSSSNPNVASVNENTGEVTIVADGSATITATFPGNAEYKSGSAYYTITVNPAPTTLPFTESFTESTGTMGWSGNAASGTIAYDNEGWEATNANGAGGSAKFGKSSGLGKATTPEIHYSGNATLTFKAGAWDSASESTNLKLSVSSGTICSDASLTTSVSSVTLAKGAWTEYTLYLKDLANPFTVTFEGNGASASRFFLDDINIVEGIEQPAPAFGASISNTENVSAAGGTKVVTVSGNVSWTAAATNGATVSPASGTGVGSVTVTIPENSSVESTASYVVTVSTTAEVSPNSYEFTITQDAASVVVNTSTEDNPYTPSEAYELADQLDGSTTLSDVYVYGIISEITEEYNEEHHNVTFNVSADGLTTGTQFTLFRVPATRASDYQVGDAVEFKGTLKNYGGDTPELTAPFTKIYQYKAPTFSPDGGTFGDSQNVTITADEGVTIRYTLDGTNPTAATGTVYESAISISESTTIKAIGTKNGIVTGIVSATFTKSSGGANYTYEFTSQQFSKNESKTLNNVSWTLTGTPNYWGYEEERGQQFGSRKNPAVNAILSTSGISGTISSVKVSASAYSSNATIEVSVNGVSWGSENLTSTNTEYEFTGTPATGTIVITLSNPATGGRALYIKKIIVE